MDREQFLALLNRMLGEGEPLSAAELGELAAAAAEHATEPRRPRPLPGVAQMQVDTFTQHAPCASSSPMPKARRL